MDSPKKPFLLSPTGYDSPFEIGVRPSQPKIDMSKVKSDSEDESIITDQEAHLTPENLNPSIQRDNSKLFGTSTKSIPPEIGGKSL
jgi:hypothetical protein